MPHDRAAIMRDAWAMTRWAMRAMGYAARQLREVFAHHLRGAWAKARRAASLAGRSAASLAAAIDAQENIDRLGAAGLDALDELRRAHREAMAREAAEVVPEASPEPRAAMSAPLCATNARARAREAHRRPERHGRLHRSRLRGRALSPPLHEQPAPKEDAR